MGNQLGGSEDAFLFVPFTFLVILALRHYGPGFGADPHLQKGHQSMMR